MQGILHCVMWLLKKLYLFLAIIVQVGHGQRDMLKDYCLTQEQFYMVFYRNALK